MNVCNIVERKTLESVDVDWSYTQENYSNQSSTGFQINFHYVFYN